MILLTMQQFSCLSESARNEILELKPDVNTFSVLGAPGRRIGVGAASTPEYPPIAWTEELCVRALQGLGPKTLVRIAALIRAGEGASRAEIEKLGEEQGHPTIDWRGFGTTLTRRFRGVTESSKEVSILKWRDADVRAKDRLYLGMDLRKALAGALWSFAQLDVRKFAETMSPTVPNRDRGDGDEKADAMAKPALPSPVAATADPVAAPQVAQAAAPQVEHSKADDDDDPSTMADVGASSLFRLYGSD